MDVRKDIPVDVSANIPTSRMSRTTTSRMFRETPMWTSSEASQTSWTTPYPYTTEDIQKFWWTVSTMTGVVTSQTVLRPPLRRTTSSTVSAKTPYSRTDVCGDVEWYIAVNILKDNDEDAGTSVMDLIGDKSRTTCKCPPGCSS